MLIWYYFFDFYWYWIRVDIDIFWWWFPEHCHIPADRRSVNLPSMESVPVVASFLSADDRVPKKCLVYEGKSWKIRSKWMIWGGYPYFRKPLNSVPFVSTVPTIPSCKNRSLDMWESRHCTKRPWGKIGSRGQQWSIWRGDERKWHIQIIAFWLYCVT